MNVYRRIESGLSSQDERSISAVLIAYANSIDTRDWALFRSCFTADCQADCGNFGCWNNLVDLADYMRNAHSGLGATLHRISNIQLAAISGGASSLCYVDALSRQVNEKGPVHRGIGTHEDFLVRTGDGWKIARQTFTAMILE
ncbi:nuclear transport factor 2 family protein [Croceicoccus sp. F390]|uniref:Nuclear transport factor 2 family protein n=1 Tax=Croceicoccus esteveae TaxID=3075597 RepID=A0ABU2ZIA6_9SPHN|nr:nuclear transport factor 2 family protein [Croceicoccus sp. F390]MDT0576342.1 nuclear transport factor 2 family protein [Croceicoccus sp. F390]